MLLHVLSYYTLCSVVMCYIELLHDVQCFPCCKGLLLVVQCCYTCHCVVEFCAAVLYVVMSSCMLCNVVTCYQELLHAVQCC